MRNVAVLGAESLIGSELLRILDERNFPASDIYLMSDSQTAANSMIFKERYIELHADYEAFADNVGLVFSCLDRVKSRAAAERFKGKAVVIDCSRAFSFAPDVLKVIPEINAGSITGDAALIANPGPIVIETLLPLYPLHKDFGLRSVHAVALVAVSDFGKDALEELRYECEYMAFDEPVERAGDGFFPYTIAGNILPQIGDFVGQSITEEEATFTRELSSFLGTNEIRIGITAALVPVRRGSCVVIHVGFEKELSPDDAAAVLKEATGVTFIEDAERYPMPESVVGKDEVFVGRLRKDEVLENGLSMWIAADNLRKGSALNAVQIAELLPA